ncbi:hypothetical protein HHK36_022982 [Tetracentron sinense]|uniref:Di19 C-terminal domain-containing protein n=1 Tax=Tetracentron sinense TaxID=13715 RepID=A0A834YU50_TETSI|nr:hypothetical protein HHK36_022982 [Tetracentron sinense]
MLPRPFFPFFSYMVHIPNIVFSYFHYMDAMLLNSLTRGYMQRKRRFRKGGSHSTLSLLRKELREGNIQSLIGGSSCTVPSSSVAPDPLLSSFIYNLPMVDEPGNVQPHFSAEASSVDKSLVENALERNVQPSPPLSEKDQEEKARRSEFVQGLLFSTILDDNL